VVQVLCASIASMGREMNMDITTTIRGSLTVTDAGRRAF